MNKRGQGGTEEMLIFHIVIPLLALMIGVGLFFYASSNADLTQFWKNFYSKDIALTLDSVYGVNGDVDLTYKIRDPKHHFAYLIDEGVVGVRQTDERDLVVKFFYAKSDKVGLAKGLNLYETFPITKVGAVVDFAKQEPSPCSIIETKDENYKQKKYYVEVFGQGTQSRAKDLSLLVKQRLDILNYPLADNPTTAHVWIYVTQSDEPKTKVYYESLTNPKSQKLSCILSKKIDATQVAFLPYGDYDVLKKNPSIIIEIGDLDISNYPTKIEQALKEYYE